MVNLEHPNGIDMKTLLQDHVDINVEVWFEHWENRLTGKLTRVGIDLISLQPAGYRNEWHIAISAIKAFRKA